MRWFTALLACAVIQVHAPPAARSVAITIDDLPRGGGSPSALADVLAMTDKLLTPLREQRIPVIGFVNEGTHGELGADGLRKILDRWLDAGADLGNHTYSHRDINNIALDEYTADIVKGEPMIRAVLAPRGKTLRFFRHPFLHAGRTPETKKGLQDFLDKHGYRVAPVTIDNADYMYASLYIKSEHRERVRKEYLPYMESVVAFFEARSVEVVAREFPQVLLLHANQLNADYMPDLLAMFRRRGYSFVSLEQALADEAYRLPDAYAGPGGFSWIHRWSMTKRMPNKGEPDPPAWVQTAFARARSSARRSP